MKESEAQKSDDDSEDDVPIASVVLKNKQCSLTLQQIEDCKVGPLGEKAIGVTVAKHFDGVEYRGTVDSWRSVRKRSYYHVTYTDGDEEELSQIELRDGYVLGLSETINAEWNKFNLGKTQTELEDSDKEDNQDINEEMSEGEGSVYDKDSDEEIIARGIKRRRKEKEKTTKKKPIKRLGGRRKQQTIAGLVLPQPGDKSVAGEAFGKLDSTQRDVLTGNINKKTKQVSSPSISFLIQVLDTTPPYAPIFLIQGCEGIRQGANLRCWVFERCEK